MGYSYHHEACNIHSRIELIFGSTNGVYQHVGIKLHNYAPWLWSNLVPHFNDNDHFFVEIAIHTANSVKTGSAIRNNENDQSIYGN